MTRIDSPGYLRGCMRPDCDTSFNIMTGEGLSDVPGWRQLTRVVTGYLCPAHSPVVLSGTHVPKHLRPGGERAAYAVGCACDWEWTPEGDAVAGDYWEAWLAHLMEVDQPATLTP